MSDFNDSLQALMDAMQDYGNAVKSKLGIAVLQGMRIELGHSAQQSNARGIDKGTYYQLDMSIGQTTYNGLQVQNQTDGTVILPAGLYSVVGGGKILSPDTTSLVFTMPAQMILAAGIQSSLFPGIYQYSVQSYPEQTFNVSGHPANGPIPGVAGMSRMTGTMSSDGQTPIWLAFSKVFDTTNTDTLALQGYVEFLKIG